MIDRLLNRLKIIWPFFIVAVALYLGVLGWFWWTQWSGAQAVTARLAIGDSARDIFTWLLTGLSVVGAGAACWFFLAPSRNFHLGFVALLPYIFTWGAISFWGANTSMIEPDSAFKFCTFKSDSLTISGYYDLSVSERKRAPPYYDPKTGDEMISCAEAERKRDQIKQARKLEMEQRQSQEEEVRRSRAAAEAIALREIDRQAQLAKEETERQIRLAREETERQARLVREQNETQARVAAEIRAAEIRANRGPVISKVYTTMYNCNNSPMEFLPAGGGFVICIIYGEEPVRLYPATFLVTSENPFFGGRGSAEVSITPGTSSLTVGPWGPLNQGDYSFQLSTEGKLVANGRLRVRQ